ncbi:MAG: GH92 family glycosyl hydrolase [Bacteroidetes bacterium]|jgi:predicted alpha-1,2-mannosidase|nr:GH92 family glycosyl hydrolase [Bacteroidota bacterium]
MVFQNPFEENQLFGILPKVKLFLMLLSIPVVSVTAQKQQDSGPAQYVNPFIGTQRMGHTFPGATVPFGMVQLSPDTDTVAYEKDGKYNPDVYAYCAGYQYDDPNIVGFSHTHFSGTGHSDLGDLLLMPVTGKLKLNPGTAAQPETGYRSRFDHQRETASPNYYQVDLLDYDIQAELTTSKRVGFHRYTFQPADQRYLILDLIHGIYNFEDKNVWTFLRVENDTLITGYRQTSGWARTRTVYFALVLSAPLKNYGHEKYDHSVYNGFYRKFDESTNFPEIGGRKIRVWLEPELPQNGKLLVKVGLSSVSAAGALNNVITEIPHWDFDLVVEQGREQWNEELSKIKIDALHKDAQTVFYTALYHSFLSPITYMDVDGRYRGLDQEIHQAEGFTNYTIFSLWDTYRALHPLFNLVQPGRSHDMAESMLAHFDQSVHPMLPVWSHYANENWCMIGYHSVSVLADAIVKGTFKGNKKRALNAAVQTANYPLYDGLDDYMQLGYVPEDKNPNAVSKTLEYAYDDWCIAQIAGIVGDSSTENDFTKRSFNYRNQFNSASGYMHPRLSDGRFKKQFDPYDTHGQGFIEGNAWNYGMYVPHQIPEMITLMGGKKAFEAKLDSLFTVELSDEHIAKNEDITRDGIIGLYVHGNEPGHHIPYLYNETDAPQKTQERVRMIQKTMYANAPDGLCGNDDCGQMSAWYIFSALGFYPVCPGSDDYAIGSPSVKSARVDLGNGKFLDIKANNQSEQNIYVKEVRLNGKKITGHYLSHRALIQGGLLEFEMVDKP